MEVAGLGMISQVDPLPGVSDDVLGARVLAVASPHQSLGKTKQVSYGHGNSESA